MTCFSVQLTVKLWIAVITLVHVVLLCVHVDAGKIKPLFSSRTTETAQRHEILIVIHKNSVVHMDLDIPIIRGRYMHPKSIATRCDRLFLFVYLF